MKLTVSKPVEVEATHIVVNVPVRYGTEDIPEDFPFRRPWMAGDTRANHGHEYDRWVVFVELDTGKICNWPAGTAASVDMKVCDEGNYTLANIRMATVGFDAVMLAEIKEDYVPCCVPGRYGDYIEFEIDANGVVKDWAKFCTATNIQKSFFVKE